MAWSIWSKVPNLQRVTEKWHDKNEDKRNHLTVKSHCFFFQELSIRADYKMGSTTQKQPRIWISHNRKFFVETEEKHFFLEQADLVKSAGLVTNQFKNVENTQCVSKGTFSAISGGFCGCVSRGWDIVEEWRTWVDQKTEKEVWV